MVRNYKRKTVERWNKQDLLDAVRSIKDNILKTQDAAKRFGISRATLYRQFKRYMLGGCEPDIILSKKPGGGHSILKQVEEEILEKTLENLVGQGYTISVRDVKRICFEYCDSNEISNKFNKTERLASSDWYYGYIKRRPNVVKLIKIKRDTSHPREKKNNNALNSRKNGRLAAKTSNGQQKKHKSKENAINLQMGDCQFPTPRRSARKLVK